MYLGIGVVPVPRMVPGVSRSGATIVGAMLFGADRRSAAEFSFWLAMPTMVGAFAYEAYKSRARARATATSLLIAVGFVVSFIFGWIVVKTFLATCSATASRCSPGGASSSARSGSVALYFAVKALTATRLAAELAGLAEAPEIGRHDRLDRCRLDAERLERAAFALGGVRHDVVAAQQLDLVGRSSGFGMNCRNARLAAWRAANGSGTSSRRRSIVASMYSISSLKVRTSGPPSS